MFKWLKSKEKSEFKTTAVLKKTVGWTRKGEPGKPREQLPDETITFFLQEDQFGNRRYTHHSYGHCKDLNSHESYEGELILWKDTGILPDGADPVEFIILKK